MAKRSQVETEQPEPKVADNGDDGGQHTETAPKAGEAPIDSLIAGMSEPSPDAIAAMRQDETSEMDTAPSPAAVPVKRGRGRPKGATSKVKIPGTGAKENVAIAPPEDTTASARMTAASCTQLTILAATIIGGPDFQPGMNPMVNQRDDVFLNDAYFEYCKAKNFNDIPPGVALCAALMVYAAPRFQQPATQSRMKSLAQKVGGFIGKFRRGKKHNGAHVNTGDDGERENHSRPRSFQTI